VKKEDIHVSVDGNYVNISGEVKQEIDEKKDGKRRSERYFASVSRAFSLASEVDDSAVIAKLDNGVLSPTLPKKPPRKPSGSYIETSDDAGGPPPVGLPASIFYRPEPRRFAHP
jgi:HSP20 family protein